MLTISALATRRSAHPQSFPFDKLKIDRSFIQNLLTRDGGAIARFVHATTELANALGIETTAEGS